MTEFNRPAFENTYRLEAKETDRFYPTKVRDVIKKIIDHHLQDKEYDKNQAKI